MSIKTLQQTTGLSNTTTQINFNQELLEAISHAEISQDFLDSSVKLAYQSANLNFSPSQNNDVKAIQQELYKPPLNFPRTVVFDYELTEMQAKLIINNLQKMANMNSTAFALNLFRKGIQQSGGTVYIGLDALEGFSGYNVFNEASGEHTLQLDTNLNWLYTRLGIKQGETPFSVLSNEFVDVGGRSLSEELATSRPWQTGTYAINQLMDFLYEDIITTNQDGIIASYNAQDIEKAFDTRLLQASMKEGNWFYRTLFGYLNEALNLPGYKNKQYKFTDRNDAEAIVSMLNAQLRNLSFSYKQAGETQEINIKDNFAQFQVKSLSSGEYAVQLVEVR